MAWNSSGNTWSTPTTSWDSDALWNQFIQQTPNWQGMSAGQKKTAFHKWWEGNRSNWESAWNTANQPWAETMQGWRDDPDRPQGSFTMAMPSTPDFTGLGTWKEGQLYGAEDDPTTPEDESTQGIYDLMSRLAEELAGGSEQYSDDWIEAYARQVGFDSPEEYQAMMKEEQARRLRLAEELELSAKNQKTGTVSPEQQKQIRMMQQEQEASARKQAEAMYQETGSYAVLQRASDELNRASVNDAMKQQMEMALQNFSTALSAEKQQSETLMRMVESGDQSLMYYVQAQQAGVTAALQAYQDQAKMILTDYDQQYNAMQQTFSNDQQQYEAAALQYKNDMDAWNAQYDMMVKAAAKAMGGDNASDAAFAWYQEVLTGLTDAATDEIENAAAQGAATGAQVQAVTNAFLVALGIILLFVPGAQGGGVTLIGIGGQGLAENDWGALAGGTSTNTGTPEPTPETTYASGG